MNEIITIRDELYLVKRRVKIENNPIVESWKEYLNCDTAFKHAPSGFYLFCNHIPNVSFEESTDENTTTSSNRASYESYSQQ